MSITSSTQIPPALVELIRAVRLVAFDFDGVFTDNAVYVFEDGREAVRRYEEAMSAGQPFDVVVMDLTVPGGMGGKEALRELRKLDAGVCAIASSAYLSDATRVEVLSAGFSAWIPKPFTVEQLCESLASVQPNDLSMRLPLRQGPQVEA